jgi:protein TonB
MTGTGFFEQKTVRPGGLALVIAMHAAAFAALMLVKTSVEAGASPITRMFDVPMPRPKEETPPEPPREQPRQQPTSLDTVRPIVDTDVPRPTVSDPPMPPLPPLPNTGREIALADGTPDLPPAPVRIEAQVDPRYAGDLQPPYPPSEESAQREGVVRVRITIGADGRVKAVQRISATSDAFWRATERHALARWRFRPATLDGRPIESSKVMNLYFRIEA